MNSKRTPMTTFGKIKSIIAVLIVFLLILATNIIDKDNFARIEESVEKIYEEQLFTKDAIRDLTNLYHQKEVAFLKMDTVYFALKREAANQQINLLLSNCENRELNRKEGVIVADLKDNSEKLFAMESRSDFFAADSEAYYNHLMVIDEGIEKLGQLQMEEGRRQKMVSRDAMESTKLFSRIEVYLLIAIAIGIQFIILYPTKKT